MTRGRGDRPVPAVQTPQSLPVVIVGAGPVGLALANDLGQRGVGCLVVERSASHSPLPKMNHVNTRSMELCRRWGLAERVREAGWPEDYPLDVAYVTSLTGYEVARFRFASQRERGAIDYTPEPSQRCPQIWFDPILEQALDRYADVELRRGWELVSFADRGSRVVVRIRSVAGGEEHEIETRYLVGADGAGSTVRQQAGIGREDPGLAPQQVAISLRARDFFGFHDKARAAFYFVIDEFGLRGVLTPTDGETLWRFNWNLRPDESLEAFDADAAIRSLAGADFDYDVVAIMPWKIRFTLADRYRLGRVFLCGDAARTLSPTGGLGMNTGLADAADLGWKLAARLAGWGGEALLESYDAERRAAGRGINAESLRNLGRIAGIPRHSKIAAAGSDGDAERARAKQVLEDGDFRMEWSNDGAVLGARYTDSPVIVDDGSTPPPYDPNHYVAAAAPGFRAPHLPLADGRSTLDLFGPGFCLLRLGVSPPATDEFETAAAAVGVPLTVHTIADRELARLYERALVLVRPDGTIAWRSDHTPTNPARLVDRVRGAIPG